MEQFEKRGYWWLPANPEREIPGTLLYGHDTESELQLLGSTRDGIDAIQTMMRWGAEHRPELILGLASDGTKFTLYDCLQTGGSLSAFMLETFHPSIVIEGRHFQSPQELVFEHLTMRLSHLGEWFQHTGREITIDDPETDQRKYTLTYQRPEILCIAFDEGRIEFGHDHRVKFARFRGDFTISEEACVSVYPTNPLPITEFLQECLPVVSNFLSLCIGRTLTILELRGRVAADCAGKSPEEICRVPAVKLYWKKLLRGDEDKEFFPHDMVATCSDFGENLERCLQTWTRAYHEIKPVMQLFFGRVLPKDSVSANSFINAVQAVEAYHRYRRDGLDIPEADHEARLTSILNSVNDEYRDWLRQKLYYSNEKGLRRRLKELLREHQGLFELSNDDIGSIAHRTTELRNFFTHYTGNPTPDFGTGEEFYRFGELFKWLMMACLLEEANIARDRAHSLIKRNQAFLYFRTVHLKGQQADVVKVEKVSAEEVTKLESS